jgi:E3 ubiquitin-protein ligase DOA10
MGLGIFLSIAAVGGLCFGIYIGVRNYWLAIQSNITNKPLRVSMMSILFLSMAYFIMVVLFVAWVLYMINTSAPLTGFMN